MEKQSLVDAVSRLGEEVQETNDEIKYLKFINESQAGVVKTLCKAQKKPCCVV